jgi:16S rRNA processing protein RimM
MATQEGDIVIARVAKARGIKGEVVCDVETDFPERFEAPRQVKLKKRDGAAFQAEIEDAWFHNHRVVLKFAGYDTMTAAQGLAGALVLIPESESAPLADDQFREFEIIGAEVVNKSGDRLGQVARVMHTGGTDLLVIEGEGGREYMIPFADDICIKVDALARRIKVDPPDGLLDL